MKLEDYNKARQIVNNLSAINHDIDCLTRIKQEETFHALVMRKNTHDIIYQLYTTEVIEKVVDFLLKEFGDQRFALQTEFDNI